MAFLRVRADWRKLIMANYSVDPSILQPYVPFGTTLDLWSGKCYVSLVGFLFLKSSLNGIPIPGHSRFEEVNLRFYVYREEGDLHKRGVVFVREYVPKPAVTIVANRIFAEHYETIRMNHDWQLREHQWSIRYSWKKKTWHSMSLSTQDKRMPLTPGSMEDFFTEHYWGYTKLKEDKTLEYFVDHPPWEVYPVPTYKLDVNFEENYGSTFAFLNDRQPDSVFLAEGSPISLQKSQLIRKV